MGKVLASIAVEQKPRLVAAPNESLAKIASDWKKPDALFLIQKRACSLRSGLLAKNSSRIARDVRIEPRWENQKMALVSHLADFSFDRYLLFAPASTHLGRRRATQVLTASSRKS